VNWFTETSSPSLTIPRTANTRVTKGIVMSDYLDDFDGEFEDEDLYELMQDDFDPDRFYKALSQALEQLENLNKEAA
jgi:hypothetical protein